jgi:hypothetical protein
VLQRAGAHPSRAPTRPLTARREPWSPPWRTAWAIFVAGGTDKVRELAAGTGAASGERPRQLVEAASSGNLDHALAAVPPESRQAASDAAREGFLAGLNDVLTLGRWSASRAP